MNMAEFGTGLSRTDSKWIVDIYISSFIHLTDSDEDSTNVKESQMAPVSRHVYFLLDLVGSSHAFGFEHVPRHGHERDKATESERALNCRGAFGRSANTTFVHIWAIHVASMLIIGSLGPISTVQPGELSIDALLRSLRATTTKYQFYFYSRVQIFSSKILNFF